MEKANVNDLAREFNVKSALVMTELKKIGVMVISSETPVDSGIAQRVRKRLQLLADQVVEEAQKAERAREKAAKAKAAKKEAAPPQARARKSIKELGKKAAAEPKETPAETLPAPASIPITAEASVPAAEEPPPIPKKTTKPRIEAAPVPKKTAKPRTEGAPVRKKAPAEVVEKPAKAEPEIRQAMKPRKGLKHFTKDDQLVAVSEVPVPPPVPEEAGQEAVQAVVHPIAAKPAAEAVPLQESVAAGPAPSPAGAPPRRPIPEVRRPLTKPATILKKSAAEPVGTEVVRRIERIVPVAPGPPPRPHVPRALQHHHRQRREKKPEPPPLPPMRIPVVRPERPVFTELRPVTMSEAVTVKELSEKLDVKSKDILRELLNKGTLVTINQTLDEKTVDEICALFGFKANIVSFEEEVFEQQAQSERAEDRVTRAPVVTVMGHVDHGKTSLLDAIREAKVAEKEAGGITQHIGAYDVDINGRRIVFLDTPGHEAFTMMRARGAKVTDIVVLVVAADDGVMPQTLEAIDHARVAQVPIIVAINKIDKPSASIDRVKQELADHNLLAEDWGGETVTVAVSALMKTNLDLLLEMILLVADIRDSKANPKLAGTGAILEAKLDKGRGSVATVLVQNGTVHVGDSFIAGAVYGKVRAMFDHLGRPVEAAGPSTAVEILGLQGMPGAGDPFQVLDDTVKAKQIGSVRQARLRDRDLRKSARLTLDHLHEQLKAGSVKELGIVIKADVQGSAEVLTDSLQKLSTEKVKVRVFHSGVGAITESDVLLASASNAIVIGFNVRPERGAADLAEQEIVDIRLHTVIYNVATEIQSAMLGLLEHTFKEKHVGRVGVRETFRVPKVGVVAGAQVLDGVFSRGAQVRLLRDSVVVYEGKVRSLRRFKEDVSEVKAGYECGFSLENFSDVKIGDIVEVFTQEKVQPKLQ